MCNAVYNKIFTSMFEKRIIVAKMVTNKFMIFSSNPVQPHVNAKLVFALCRVVCDF